ncbi:biotin synthase [Tepidimonas sp.]|uniref:biotin synthase n=1 Tax=Tepidimonas sp. TaxID=2002775 RepID=UPI002FE101E9
MASAHAHFPLVSTDGSRVPELDAVATARWRQRVPKASPWLHDWVGGRMAERLDWIRAQPSAWVSWSPLLAGETAHRAVVQRYPQARVWLAGELGAATWARWQPRAQPWWRRWRRAAQVAQTPWGLLAGVAAPDQPVPQSVGLVWANMVLHLTAEPRRLLQQWYDWLVEDGFLMFSCLGPDTARELRAVHAAMGWPPPAAPYVDMHDWGDLLVAVGFAEPVMDMERVTLTYPDAQRLLAELRTTGRNWHPARHPALRGRAWQTRWLQAVQEHLPRDAQGRLCLTVEVVYGHAIRPRPRLTVAAETRVPLQHLRQALRPRAQEAARPAAEDR